MSGNTLYLRIDLVLLEELNQYLGSSNPILPLLRLNRTDLKSIKILGIIFFMDYKITSFISRVPRHYRIYICKP